MPAPCFNTQPPEGGWHVSFLKSFRICCFNTQPPEGGWAVKEVYDPNLDVSTHSRLKAAGQGGGEGERCGRVSTHSRLKAAGSRLSAPSVSNTCFNTQPPEGGWVPLIVMWVLFKCFNTQPPEGGWTRKAAFYQRYSCFNTQPPEGGWYCRCPFQINASRFNTQPPEGGWIFCCC